MRYGKKQGLSGEQMEGGAKDTALLEPHLAPVTGFPSERVASEALLTMSISDALHLHTGPELGL